MSIFNLIGASGGGSEYILETGTVSRSSTTKMYIHLEKITEVVAFVVFPNGGGLGTGNTHAAYYPYGIGSNYVRMQSSREINTDGYISISNRTLTLTAVSSAKPWKEETYTYFVIGK